MNDEGEIEGGCDGCLNMEQDLQGNMGLQYTIATLEKLYLEADYPSHKRVPKLPKSPRDLGISRADLWAFAGMVALDRFQANTKSVCSGQEKTGGATCRWWERPDYDPSQCFQGMQILHNKFHFNQSFSEFKKSDALSMFKTGRSDCEVNISSLKSFIIIRPSHSGQLLCQ